MSPHRSGADGRPGQRVTTATRRPGRARRITGTLLTISTVAWGLFLVWRPVLGPHLPAPLRAAVYAGMGVATVVAFPFARRRGGLPAAALAAFWLGMALRQPVWSSWQAGGPVVRAEERALLLAAAASLSVAVLVGGTRRGVTAARWLWLLVLASTVPIGLWESLTGGYLTVDPFFGPTGAPNATFGNPNNFACTLLLGVGLASLRAVESVSAPARAVLALIAAGGACLIVLTNSRMALVCLLLVLAVVAAEALRRYGVVEWARAHPLVATALGMSTGIATIAAFAVPALRRINLFYRILVAGDVATTFSDEYRLFLLRYGLHLWLQSPRSGVGGGRFESLLRLDYPDNHLIPHPHNAAVELLAEYGLVCAAPLAFVGVVLGWRVVGARRRTGGSRRDAPTDGASLLVLLIAIAYGGIIIDSAIGWTPWWLMIGTAVGVAWRVAPPQPEDRPELPPAARRSGVSPRPGPDAA